MQGHRLEGILNLGSLYSGYKEMCLIGGEWTDGGRKFINSFSHLIDWAHRKGYKTHGSFSCSRIWSCKILSSLGVPEAKLFHYYYSQHDPHLQPEEQTQSTFCYFSQIYLFCPKLGYVGQVTSSLFLALSSHLRQWLSYISCLTSSMLQNWWASRCCGARKNFKLFQ